MKVFFFYICVGFIYQLTFSGVSNLCLHFFVCVFFSENILFGMGNPLLDITAVVDKDFLDK